MGKVQTEEKQKRKEQGIGLVLFAFCFSARREARGLLLVWLRNSNLWRLTEVVLERQERSPYSKLALGDLRDVVVAHANLEAGCVERIDESQTHRHRVVVHLLTNRKVRLLERRESSALEVRRPAIV